MEPRKKSQKKRTSTNFPPDYLKSIQKLFTDAFKKHLTGKALYLEGRILSDEILLSVGFKPDPKGLVQINFEASIDHSGADVFPQVGVCVDAISAMMEHYFKTGEKEDLPKLWQEYPVGKNKVFLQVSARNTDLENEANRLLGIETNDALVKVHESEEELEDALDESEDPKTRH
ncbi:MAG: hypothetical protein AB7F59_06820 [Bdellovibrionales bacterium]